MELTPPSERDWTEEDRQWFERVRSLEAKVTELTILIRELGESLFEARRKATEVVDTIVMYRHKYSERTYLEGAAKVRNEVSVLIDAALAKLPKEL